MSSRGLGLLAALLAALSVSAAPVQKEAPVAAGFPAWQGLSDKSFICGRRLTPSDLRHRLTIVIEVEPGEKLEEQLLTAHVLVMNASVLRIFGLGADLETAELPRDVVAVVSVRNATHKQILDAIDYNKPRSIDDKKIFVAMQMVGTGWSFYDNVTFPGAPDSSGKRPFFYIMGPTGTEPIYQGELTPLKARMAVSFIQKTLMDMSKAETKWRPFYGTVAEPKYNKTLTKALEKGKKAKKAPLLSVEKALLLDVTSKDEEKANEAQVLYDALVQTRNELVLRINIEFARWPYRAYYDIQELLKYWPAEVKQIEKTQAKLKEFPDAPTLGKIYSQLVEWEDPAFTCKNASEAKKILVELGKFKKTLSGLKENAKDINIQDSALRLDAKVDALIPAMQARAEGK